MQQKVQNKGTRRRIDVFLKRVSSPLDTHNREMFPGTKMYPRPPHLPRKYDVRSIRIAWYLVEVADGTRVKGGTPQLPCELSKASNTGAENTGKRHPPDEVFRTGLPPRTYRQNSSGKIKDQMVGTESDQFEKWSTARLSKNEV